MAGSPPQPLGTMIAPCPLTGLVLVRCAGMISTGLLLLIGGGCLAMEPADPWIDAETARHEPADDDYGILGVWTI